MLTNEWKKDLKLCRGTDEYPKGKPSLWSSGQERKQYFNSVRKAQATICIFLRCMLQDFRTSLKRLTYPSSPHSLPDTKKWSCTATFFRGLYPAALSLELKIHLVRGMDIKTRPCPVRHTVAVDPFESKMMYSFNPSQVSLNSSAAIYCIWPVSCRAHHEMFFLQENKVQLTKEFSAGFAGRCQDILNKQIGKNVLYF